MASAGIGNEGGASRGWDLLVTPVLACLLGAGTRCLSRVWAQSPALYWLPHFSTEFFCGYVGFTETRGCCGSCSCRLSIWMRKDGLAGSNVALTSVSRPLV